jgi:hypothetical protein
VSRGVWATATTEQEVAEATQDLRMPAGVVIASQWSALRS